MGRHPSEIAQQVAEAVRGDTEATREISEAIESRDAGRIKTVLHDRAGVQVTDEEVRDALAETEDVMPYVT